MTNTFNYTPTQVAEVALALADTQYRLAKVVRRFGENDFRPGRGSTVYLNVPGALTAHSRSLSDTETAIVLDSLTEAQEPVSLDVHAYSAVGLSEHDLSLGIEDFARQVLRPQVDAVVEKVESAIETVIDGIAPTAGIAYSATDPVATFTAGRRALRDRGVDVASADLVAIVGANIVDALLDSGALDYAKTGTPDALRGGSLGRIRGFDAVESSRIADDEIVFMHRESIYLAHRAPAVPQGASFGQTINAEGAIGLRYLRDYDVAFTRDRSMVSTFVGAGILPLYKVTRTNDTGVQGDAGFVAGGAVVTEVAGGAVVKVDTAAI